jgi:hypothetical protein
MERSTIRGLVIGGGVVLAALAYGAGRARAGGAASVPTFFTGSLLNNGVAASGSQQIGFDLWSDPTSTADVDHVCSMPASAVMVGAAGLFQIQLSTACQAVFPLQTLVWYQFTVNGTAFQRQPIGAVPFATWAGAAGNVLKAVTFTTNEGGTTSTSYVSSLGAVCGTTAPTTGSFRDLTYGTVGLAASKTLCQAACGSPTAHICLYDDLVRFQEILGGTVVKATGWIEQSLDECPTVTPGVCSGEGASCNTTPTITGIPYTSGSATVTYSGCAGEIAPVNTSTCQSNTSPTSGTCYGPGGVVPNTTCDTLQPILCCD